MSAFSSDYYMMFSCYSQLFTVCIESTCHTSDTASLLHVHFTRSCIFRGNYWSFIL